MIINQKHPNQCDQTHLFHQLKPEEGNLIFFIIWIIEDWMIISKKKEIKGNSRNLLILDQNLKCRNELNLILKLIRNNNNSNKIRQIKGEKHKVQVFLLIMIMWM